MDASVQYFMRCLTSTLTLGVLGRYYYAGVHASLSITVHYSWFERMIAYLPGCLEGEEEDECIS